MPNSPVGCRGPLDSNFTMCSLSWDLADSETCSSTANPHPLCGVSVNGASVSLFQETGGWWRNVRYELRNTYQSDAYFDGSNFSLYEDYRININLPENNDTSFTRSFRARFGPASFPDHQIWNGYILPEMRVREEYIVTFVIIIFRKQQQKQKKIKHKITSVLMLIILISVL